jgi:hypothetical protein
VFKKDKLLYTIIAEVKHKFALGGKSRAVIIITFKIQPFQTEAMDRGMSDKCRRYALIFAYMHWLALKRLIDDFQERG